MTLEWNFSGYPQSYEAGFSQITDREAVQRFVSHIPATRELMQVVIETNGKESVVHVGGRGVLHQVNWADPSKVPGDYEEYARTFYEFSGPHDVQLRRATLLATTLGLALTVAEKIQR